MVDIESHATNPRLSGGLHSSLRELAETTLRLLRRKGLSVTAESCRAGKLAVLLSEVPGAAGHLQGGFVVYTKANKSQALGVPAGFSGCGGRPHRRCQPDPNEDGNPVGLVCIAAAARGQQPQAIEKRHVVAPRERIQELAMAESLATLLRAAAAKAAGARRSAED
jgi:nicotinamide-nucleotide amidase